MKLLAKLLGLRADGRRIDKAVDFKTLAEGGNDLIIRCSQDGLARYVSPSSVRLSGWTPEEILGKGPGEFIIAEDMPAVHAAFEDHDAGAESSVFAYRMRRKDGTTIWLEGSSRLVVDPATGDRDLVVIARDITGHKALEDRLSMLAMTDGLTGLANRRAFDEALESEWLRTRRAMGRLSLLLIDLDHFKGFNDHYGHQVGDDCLRAVSHTIKNALRRPADLAARYGGEELTVILPDTDLAGAVEVAEAIRAAIKALSIPHAHNGSAAAVTVSVGVATALSSVGASIQMPAGLLQAADTALYKAKANGRDRVETALLLSGDGQAAHAA